ncbi:ammonium transporter [Gemmobacter fulvus]|uniref:Ammonium transporter n=1 Tax=Gemmobacter fulvus TaxID=2840474 RepID=A0A975P449_9RHOB|nr:ammonium transporter [Gemmobacter fulvus]MBT9245680.1 ammonium transporter [Gemmobacter fulvus]MDQ1847105.1 ammonium transporter [Gemmobacter fulvus]QWK89469.1 ammonium transporter [Gemmobacter fulvus]
MKTLTKLSGLSAASAFAALPVWAQEATTEAAAATAEAVVEAAPVMDKGDVSWMMMSAVLVLFMTLPGLALFYGGLVRTKNMLSVLMQTTLVACVMMLVWVTYGYSVTFGGSTSAFWGGTSKLFLSGVTADSMSATFSAGYVIPEYLFIAFQMTFAAITPALIIGAFAERVKFSAVLVFSVLWATFCYFPIAHMVWDANGLLFQHGAIDFAGGTVVHINAGVAALVGCLVIGKRVGYGKENMAPHSMVMTMIGGSMLWVGWFGFNVGSNLEANGGATLAMINTFIATAAGVVAWSLLESVLRGKASMLGAVSGMVSGLVAITPACGTIGPMGAIALGVIAAAGCYFFVTVVKIKLKYDDSLDVFGIHGVGGIIGAVLTGVFSAASFGGVKGDDYSIAAQTWIQIESVALTVVWTGVISFILYKLVDMTIGLRVDQDAERQGLDLTSHGEAAYHG